MTLDEPECWGRLATARHGVLSTLHPNRGVDAVPVVFAVVDGLVVVPVDTVKPKRGTALGRRANVARDPRCVLLVEHYADDWSHLWWVRVHALAAEAEAEAGKGATEPVWMAALMDRYPQYRPPGSIVAALVLRPTAVMGWAATGSEPGRWAGGQ